MRSHRRSLSLLVTILAALALSLACATSPTGRTQVLLMSEPEMAEMGRTAFVQIQSNMTRSADAAKTAYVRCVANAVTSVLGTSELAPLAVTSWEVELFEDPTANAFALPGGKIGVHTGLLDVARTPGQLAAVLGHEVGHVMARHGNERVSRSYMFEQGMEMAKVMAGDDTPEKEQLFGALGVGVQYGVLMPFDRSQESEADVIGLKLMARAGFDPNESVALWENMAAASLGASPPEFMSTHPSHHTRISQLRANLPEAMPLYEQARAAGRNPTCRP